jgi:hypothetical protein
MERRDAQARERARGDVDLKPSLVWEQWTLWRNAQAGR